MGDSLGPLDAVRVLTFAMLRGARGRVWNVCGEVRWLVRCDRWEVGGLGERREVGWG